MSDKERNFLGWYHRNTTRYSSDAKVTALNKLAWKKLSDVLWPLVFK